MEEAPTPALTAPAPSMAGDGKGGGDGSSSSSSTNSNNKNNNNDMDVDDNNSSSNTNNKDINEKDSNNNSSSTNADNSSSNNEVNISSNTEIINNNSNNNESNAPKDGDDDSTSRNDHDAASKGADNLNNSSDAAAAAAAAVAVAGDPSHPLDEGGCFVCKRNDQQDLILLCDGCDGEYHTYCVKPPVRKIPENEWFCHQCRAAGKGGPKPDPVSRYTGVYWAGTVKANVCTAAWTAKIRRRAGRGEATIGSYPSEKEAAGAYDAEAKRVFGDAHPPLNFPDGNWDDEPDEPDEPEPEEPEERDGPKQPEDPGVLGHQEAPDEPHQREKPDAPLAQPREVEESKQEEKADEPSQLGEPDDPTKQPEEPDEPTQAEERDDEPKRPENSAGPGLQEESSGNQQEEAKEPNELADPWQDAETPITEHVGGGGDAVWVNVSDVGGHGTSTSGRRESSFAGAGIGSGASSTTGGTSSGGPSSMYTGGVAGGGGGHGSSARKSGAESILSGPGMGTAQTPSSGASSGLSDMEVERPTKAGVAATEKAAIVPRHKDGRSGDDRAGTPGAIGTSSTSASSARPEIGGLDASRGVGGERPTPLQTRPQLSVDIPADGLNAEAEGLSLSSHKDKRNSGGGGGSAVSTPTDTPTGRKRVKAKWLQEYEHGDDMENPEARSLRGAARAKKSDKHRGSNDTRVASAASADAADGSGRTASQTHSARKRGMESDDAAVGSPRSADGAARDRKKGKGKAPHKKKAPWGGKDWAGHALSKSSLKVIKDTMRMWATSEDGTLVGEDGNHFFCSVCGEHGELTCCDYCPRVFHEECLTLGTDSQLAAEHQTEEDPWNCPVCVEAGLVNLVQGVVPEWTPEQRQQTPKPVTTKKAARKTSGNSSSSRSHKKGGNRPSTSSAPSLPSPRPEVAAARNTAPRRAAVGHAGAASSSSAAAAAVTAATVASPAPVTANVNDAVDPPLIVSRVNVFAPELDNFLLRSLLYDEKYTHVLPKIVAKKQKAARTRATQPPRGAVQDRPTEEGSATTATVDAFDVRTGMPMARPEPTLGALTAHLPLSSQAGKRPRNLQLNSGTRLGPAFGGSAGPNGVLDGSAVTFGARAMGSFRSGLAANMVDVGLVPDEVAAKAGYSRLAEAEEALVKEAENNGLAGSGAASTAKANPFGSASADWWSRAPTDGKGYSGPGQQGRSQKSGGFGGDPVGRDSGHPYDGAGGAPRRIGQQRLDGARQPANGASRPATHRPDRRQMAYAERERGGSAASMDVDEDMRDEVWDPRGAERGHGGSNNGPNYARRGPSASAGQGGEPIGGRARQEREGARPVGRVDREKGLETNKETRKENRRWNLKHMRATQDEGKMDVCACCRLHPDGGLMVCANQELARVHSFCFPCLAKKQSIEKNNLTAGSIKWNCPTCRERKERPQRRAQPPSSLRGAAWAGGGVLTSPCALPHGAGHQTFGPGANGRFREPDRGVMSGGEGRGIKRTLSSTEVSTAARENQGRSSPSSFLPEVLPSSSAEGGGDAYAFRRDTSPRGSDASGGGGGGGAAATAAAAAAAAAGEGWSEEGPAPPAKPSIERKRLLRLVVTLVLDRLQGLDPLDLFKDPVPSGVAGYAEAIDFPIDFSTIRRRSQWGLYASIRELAFDIELLCANAMTFNAAGTVYHTAAISVLEGAKRLWPQATALLDSLSSAETTASKHRLRGPAASSDAWPLDGHFAGFEVTPANESAYYMHVAIRRAAAAYRAREEEEAKIESMKDARVENLGEAACLGIAGRGTGNGNNGVGGRGVRGERERGGGGGDDDDALKEDRVKVAVDAAVFAASSAAFLYTRGQMCDEESLLRDSLSAFKADSVEKSLRREADCAKCEPIDRATLLSRDAHTRPLPTPVARRKAAPDAEFLALDPEDDQPAPKSPNPKFEEETTESSAVAVAPEWRVLQAAHGAKQRSGEESARHMRTFRKFFKEVDARSRTRLRVDKSTVQGLGVFATQAIRAHELVTEYKGERLNLEEAQKRAATYRETDVMDYVVRLDENSFIDATKKGNVSRFFNHSCAPNCYMKTVAAGKEQALDKRVCFFSLREIRAGEEISYSYPAPHNVGLGVVVAPECACRAPGCRGRMSTREQL